jgi:iron complex outermembrane recepter protein
MKKKTKHAALICSMVMVGQLWSFAQNDVEGPILDLEEFKTVEISQELSDSLMPTDRTVGSAFFADMELLDIPRSILVLSPEIMEQFQIEDFGDLEKIGAGTERYNFYGIAGAPVLRGWQGGIYFNGMLRAFQRNEMPTSFGALEAMEVVKGPAPAQFIPSHVGGYVNMLPKSPFFDDSRGSFKFEYGSNNHYNIQVDKGGPFLAGSKPAAYRISLTSQNADTWYNNVGNDFNSIYASIKMQLGEKTYLFAGAEYYEFSSNENAAWNRPTQNLVNTGQYVIGEPLSLVREANGGYADRNLLSSSADFRALVVPASIVESAGLSAPQMAALKNMGDPEVRSAVYEGLPSDVAQTSSGYLYTPEYFLAGGSVFTEKISGKQILADPSDFADSEDLMVFADLEHYLSDTTMLTNKLFIEDISTDKLSSYQYAFRMNQTVIDDRFSLTTKLDLGGESSLVLDYGLEVRKTEATQLQDFWAEPFSRRDISRPEISSNTVFLSGAQFDPTIGNNYWGGGFGAGGPGGHAVESDLDQRGGFLSALYKLGDSFSIIASARYDTVDISAKVPDGPTDIAQNILESDDSFFNYSINPTFKINDMVSIYAAYQEASTYAPLQGGAVLGPQNFGDSELKEAGVKVSALDGKLYMSAAYYEWEQIAFNDRTNTADPFESEGIEFEMTLGIAEGTTIIASFGDRETRRTTPLGFRSMPWNLADPTGSLNDEIGVALEGGSLLHQFTDAFGGFTPQGGSPSRNPDLIMPGTPEMTAKLFIASSFENGFGVSFGGVYSDSFYASMDRFIVVPSSFVVNSNIWYEADSFKLMLSLENLLEEDYYFGADPIFAANTAISKAPDEIQARVTLTVPF